MTKDDELLASYWTMRVERFRTRTGNTVPSTSKIACRPLQKAGFKGRGNLHADLDHILVSRSLTEMKQIFDDNESRM